METELDLNLFGFSIDDDILVSSRKARQSLMETELYLKLFGFFIEDDKPRSKPQQPSTSLKLFGVESDPNDIQPKPKRPRLSAPPEPEDLPFTHRHFLLEIGADGSTVQPIATLTLTATDMSKHHSRLSMPHNQVKMGFLSHEEEAWIGMSYKKGQRDLRHKLLVTVVDPSRRSYRMNLAKWNFHPEKKKSWWYALKNDWNKLATDNRLRTGDTIQVWSFRFLYNGSLGLLIRKI